MNKKSFKSNKKSHNKLDDSEFLSFPINSDLINIPIIPNMVNISSNVPPQEIKVKKNNNKK